MFGAGFRLGLAKRGCLSSPVLSAASSHISAHCSTFGSKVHLSTTSTSSSSSISSIAVSVDASTRVASLSLNRHEGKNAFSKAMLAEFRTALDGLASREQTADRVDCFIVYSGVDKVFCAGADLKERLQMADEDVGPFVSRAKPLGTALARVCSQSL